MARLFSAGLIFYNEHHSVCIRRCGIEFAGEVAFAESDPRIWIVRYLHTDLVHP